MYCGECGYKNPPNADFCSNCGERLSKAGGSNGDLTNGRRNKHKLFVSIGSAITMICFFLPWMVVSCSGLEMQISGSQLASGNIKISDGVDTITETIGDLADFYGVDLGANNNYGPDGYAALYLILIFGICGLAVLIGERNGSLAAIAGGVLGMIGLLIVLGRAGSFKRDLEANTYGWVQLKYQIGYLGEWIGFGMQTYFGFLGYKEFNKT